MISPHTPPGTALVVIAVTRVLADALAYINPVYHQHIDALWDVRDPFSVGELVTLDAILPETWATSGHAVRLHGYKGLYALEQFKVAVLPSSLTDCLVGKRVPKLENV